MLGEGIVAGLDLLVGGLDFGSLEGRLSNKLGITNLGLWYMMTPTDQTSTS